MLTNRQKRDLHRGIYEYLAKNDYIATAESFKEECEDDVEQEGAIKNVLEKKWTSIIRLNNKIARLEATIESLNEELKSVSKMKRTKANAGDTDNLFPKFPPKHSFTGHKGVVNNVAFHPVYSVIASVGEDAAVKLWDFEAGTYDGSLKGHTQTVNDLSFDPTGSLLATCSSDLSIKVWDVDQKICTKTLNGHDHVVSSVRWKPSGDFILSASRDATIKLWELSTGYCTKTWEGHQEWVRMAVFNELGTRIASASSDQSIMLWDIEKTNEELLTFYGHEHVVEVVEFFNLENSKIEIHKAKWNPEGVKEKEKKGLKEMIEESKKKLAEGPQEAQEPENPVASLDFLVSGSRDKTIRIWSCQTAACLLTITGHDSWVRGLAIHHSGKYFYSCSDDKSIRVWSLESGKGYRKIENAHKHFVSGIASHPVYLVCATSCVDSTVAIWECK